jgi:hypothetical protein
MSRIVPDLATVLDSNQAAHSEAADYGVSREQEDE